MMWLSLDDCDAGKHDAPRNTVEHSAFPRKLIASHRKDTIFGKRFLEKLKNTYIFRNCVLRKDDGVSESGGIHLCHFLLNWKGTVEIVVITCIPPKNVVNLRNVIQS